MYFNVAGLGACEHVFIARVDWTSLIKDMCVNVRSVVLLAECVWKWSFLRGTMAAVSRRAVCICAWCVIVSSAERHPLPN